MKKNYTIEALAITSVSALASLVLSLNAMSAALPKSANVSPLASPSFAETISSEQNEAAQEIQNSENSTEFKPPLLLAPDQLRILNDKGIFFPLEVENAIRNVNNWTTQEVREYQLLCEQVQATGECATDLECSCLCEVLDFECDGGY